MADNNLHVTGEDKDTQSIEKELDKLRYEILLEEVVEQRFIELIDFAKKENL